MTKVRISIERILRKTSIDIKDFSQRFNRDVVRRSRFY